MGSVENPKAVREVMPEYRNEQLEQEARESVLGKGVSDPFLSGLLAPVPSSIQFQYAGDYAVGIITEIAMRDNGSGYGSSPVVTFRAQKGRTEHNGELVFGELYSLWFFHAVLLSQAKEARPRIGERFGVVYMGKRQPENGGDEYHDFRLKVDRSDQTFHWENIAGRTRN